MGVELGCTFRWWLTPFVPGWLARYDELAAIQSVGRTDPDGSESAKAPFQARGVRFVTKDGAWVVFWCYNRDQVLAAFAEHPVKVDLEPRRFTSLYPEG